MIGQHAYVLVDFPEPGAGQITTGDQVTIRAVGQGLRLTDHGAIGVKNCSPGLIEAMPGGTRPDGRLEVHVAARIPAEAIGAGVGMISEYANTDLMGAYAGLGEDLSLGLEHLRVGDIVALADQDHRFGRGYRPGYLTIGVISTGQCMLFGHGPGPSSLLSGPAEAFALVDDAGREPGQLVPRRRHDRQRSAAMNDQPGSVEPRPGSGQPARPGRASGLRRQPVPDRRRRCPLRTSRRRRAGARRAARRLGVRHRR